ncbi:ester cyclase [Streptomyces alkaliterrae]|uniref:ester cyclase n=1 Tax=Streptomyces alkaliterrae TaxID=2213162 RepID=UPI002B21AB47|nr:ester cyclase [Streptomyces alkaliterrae]
MESWADAAKGKRTATHAMVGQDRSDQNHVVEIVEFPSYEEAMTNSNLPETDRIFQELVALCDGMPTFTDLDVVRDEQLNKEVVQRLVDEYINGGNADALDQLCTADYREHDPANSSYDLGLAEAKSEAQAFFDAFHPRVVVESMICEGDTVAVRFSGKGRHVGEFRGLEATGREFSGTGHCTFRCEGGKIAESWWNTDDLGLMQQLGDMEG